MKIETELCQFIIAERVFDCYNAWSKILHDEIEKFEANVNDRYPKGIAACERPTPTIGELTFACP